MRLFPWPSNRTVDRLTRKVIHMSANQERLDAAVAAISEDVDTIKVEIQALKDASAAGEPLDFSRLDTLVGNIDAVAHPDSEAPEVPTDPEV